MTASSALRQLEAPSVPTKDTAPNDPRLARWLAANALTDRTRVALVGFPSDEGIRRNRGRPGAAAGPAALRKALYAMTPAARQPEAFIELVERTVDLGDVPVTGKLEADQALLGEVVGELLERGIVPIVLGGGHETAYGHFLGYVESRQLDGIGVLNWDAHADVRPLRDGQAHSGSPFRQMLDHPSGLCERYTVAGLHPWRVSAAHVAAVRERGEAVFADELTADRARQLVAELDQPTLVTFDLDALDAAPGVSAPGVGGLAVDVWLAAAEACGRSQHVRSVDLVELNPSFDIGNRSATLAALTVWHVLAGLAKR
ncbi:MAG: formimidoylglutamase [Rubricoccaceae bacterium]